MQEIDEEGLLKNMEISELALKISKLIFGWKNHSEPVIQAHKLMKEVQRVSLEISEYEYRMGTKLSDYQRNLIYNSIEEVEKLIPYLKKKVNPSQSIENFSE
ncbi:MAG: hypothetical protein R3327_02780 [Nitrosopumilaceae archaeon]|nr:hypothetical protein [Nitrosopumilaceae archaeon]